MAKCRTCGEEIDFVTLQSGARMPVEGTTSETYYIHHEAKGVPQIMVVTEDGEVIRGRLGKEHESGVLRVVGCESHFPRCST